MEYSFNINHATKYGTEEAIMIKNFAFWIKKNKANRTHLYEGRTWTFNSVRAFNELYPFWSEKQIRRILDSLITQNVLIKEQKNEAGSLRTNWYAFVNENEFITEVKPSGNDTPAEDEVKKEDVKVESQPEKNLHAADYSVSKTENSFAQKDESVEKPFAQTVNSFDQMGESKQEPFAQTDKPIAQKGEPFAQTGETLTYNNPNNKTSCSSSEENNDGNDKDFELKVRNLFITHFDRDPNFAEQEEVRKIILTDTNGYTPEDNYNLMRNAFYNALLGDEKKRTVRYVLASFKGMKHDERMKKEREKKVEETRNKYSRPRQVWNPQKDSDWVNMKNKLR